MFLNVMSDELQLIVKSLFAMKINLIPKKAISTAFPPCHHCLSSVNHGNLQGNMCNHHCFVKKKKKKKNGFTGKDIAAVRLHLSQPDHHKVHGELGRRLQGSQESPASARTVS